MNIKYITLILSIFVYSNLNAQLNVVASKPEATFQVGEQMYFNVTSNISGDVSYNIIYDDKTPVIASGIIEVNAGTTARIAFALDKPGFVICNISQGTGNNIVYSTAGAGFSPFDILPFEEEPADFDQFWTNMKAQLSAIPMDAQMSLLSETNYSKTYKLSLANIDGRRVYGYVSIPKGIDGPFPAVLTVPPYGSGPDHVRTEQFLAEVGGLISVTISIHNADPAIGDPNAYTPNDISTKEGNYYKYGLLGAVRAIDFIHTLSEFDGQNLAVSGISQGGGLSISVAGLDDRVNVLACGIPALCQHSALKYGRASDNPYFLFASRVSAGTPEHEAATLHATKYYDAMNFAKRFHGPSLTCMSFEDTTCPTETVFAANNQLIGQKIIIQERELAHSTLYFWSGRFNYFKNFFNLNPPTPFTTHDAGHFIYAGPDFSVNAYTPRSISASTKFEDIENNTFEVEWSVVSGPGSATFANSNDKNTTVSFTDSGNYLIQIKAIDDRWLEVTQDQKRVIMIDYINVNVN